MLGIIITWLGGSLYAGGILLVQIFDWPLWVCLAFLILISTSFTVTGGLAAVVITDSFQSILIIVTSAALTVIGLVKVGGVSGLIEAAPEGYWTLFRPSDAPIYPWYVIVLGYPVMSIWFWCADQTIVQRVLGAKDLRNGQLGTVFAGFIKIITPLIFLVPGILCFVLHPGLDNSDKAYMTMVTSYFPTGLIGLIIAVLIAALVSTVDSGLNSMSTVFTLDFYCKKLRPEAQRKETILVGRIVTILTAFIAFFVSWSMSFAGKNLFDLFQCLISFLAPPISAVFLLGILWKRATPKAAFTTLIVGGILSALAGICHFGGWPTDTFWPHPLVLSFLLFVGLVILMSVLSLRDQQPADKFAIATLKEIYTAKNYNPKKMWNLWILLAVIMVFLYLLFQFGI
jgi:SSS family solute:Na+ symporter